NHDLTKYSKRLGYICLLILMVVRLFKKILLLLLITTLFSCKDKNENTVRTTYIGGQIVNPTVNYIIFSKGNEILDTVKLDGKNFFQYKTEKIKNRLIFS